MWWAGVVSDSPIRWATAALLLAGCVPALAGTTQKRAVLTPWEQAERGREALEAISPDARTKADYDQALDGFRAIYHEDPADVHAPEGVFTVAELLAEQGHLRHDARSLKAAVGQYEFLRTQYPASSLRMQALLAEAQIEQNDLQDAKAAKERYRLLQTQAPGSDEAEEARAALAEMNRPAGQGATAGRPQVAVSAGSSGGLEAPVSGARHGTPGSVEGITTKARTNCGGPSTAVHSGRDDGGLSNCEAGQAASAPALAAALPVSEDTVLPRRSGPLALVSGIRHWSTPNYTRVVIDLGDTVTYEAARVPDPDRIYFDLHGTRLAQGLVGKSFAVTDDGFLKKIRAAQFRDAMTRVVLDVNDVTEYSAFLLPNPYRLIIDIHGRTLAAGTRPAITSLPAASLPVVSLPFEATVMQPGVEMKQVQGPSATPVPNTTAVRAKSSVEVAQLSDQPDRVVATSKPTSKPISAVVDERSTPSGGKESGAKDQVPDRNTSDATKSSTPGAGIASSNIIPRRRAKPKASGADGVAVGDAVPARAALPTADGETSLVRALGLKIGRIVIDAGHGGHDSGTLGVGGLEEKDVVLDVALRLGKILHDRLGAEIVYTRSDDTFIPLETRTAIANKAQADLFLSIHANSSPDATARGVETYYLNFTSQPDALEVAARENAVSDQSIHQLSDLVKKITLKDKIDESREFASDVEQSLYGGLETNNTGLKNRGVKKAPFVVLIGANMPSVLAEISFVTNPRDARQLRRPDYRQRVAESLYKGVAKYASGLSGIRVPLERASGQ